MDRSPECDDSPAEHAVSKRALRVLAVAQLRRAQFEIAQSHLLEAMERSQRLRAADLGWGNRLRETVACVAREELAAGHSSVQLVRLLHDLIDEAGLEQRIRKQVEPDVVLWGIEAYFAA